MDGFFGSLVTSFDGALARARKCLSDKTTPRSADWSSASTFTHDSPQMLLRASSAPTLGAFQLSVPPSSAPSRDQISNDDHNHRLLPLPAPRPATLLGPTTSETKITSGWGGRSALRRVVNFKDELQIQSCSPKDIRRPDRDRRAIIAKSLELSRRRSELELAGARGPSGLGQLEM